MTASASSRTHPRRPAAAEDGDGARTTHQAISAKPITGPRRPGTAAIRRPSASTAPGSTEPSVRSASPDTGGDAHPEAPEDRRRQVGREHVTVGAVLSEVRFPGESGAGQADRQLFVVAGGWFLEGDHEVVPAESPDQGRERTETRLPDSQKSAGAVRRGGSSLNFFPIEVSGEDGRGRGSQTFGPLSGPRRPDERRVDWRRPGTISAGAESARWTTGRGARRGKQSLPKLAVVLRTGSRRLGCPG